MEKVYRKKAFFSFQQENAQHFQTTEQHRYIMTCSPTHPVPEGLEADFRILEEVGNDLLLWPSPHLLLQHQGQVPVVQRHARRDPIGQQAVNHLVVVGHALGVDVTGEGVRDDAWPGDGHAVRVDLSQSPWLRLVSSHRRGVGDCLLVDCFNVQATGWCISGTDLLRQFYMLPH